MKVSASRTSGTTTISGSSHRFQMISITMAMIAVTMIFTNVSDIIEPTNDSELRRGVRWGTNHFDID